MMEFVLRFRNYADQRGAAGKPPYRRQGSASSVAAILRAPSGQVLEAVRKLGLEGVVGKRLGSVYEPGERSGAWIKRRTNMEQEFVIGGYIPGARGFDALLAGVYENKQLLFVAKVRTVLCREFGTSCSRLSRRCKLPSAHS
jgi:ATP-dependent DNA ligase